MIRLVRGVILAGIGCVVLGCGPQQEMRDAVKSGDVQSVRKHFQRGYDPNSIDVESFHYDDGPMLMTVAEVARMEKSRGGKFLTAKVELKGGRPLKMG